MGATPIDDNDADGKSGKLYGWLLIIRCTRNLFFGVLGERGYCPASDILFGYDGSVTLNTVPPPVFCFADMVPPWRSNIILARYNPTPAPSFAIFAASSPR